MTIFDASRGVGSRIKTIITDELHFNHSAQFFAAKSDKFKEFYQKAKDNNKNLKNNE